MPSSSPPSPRPLITCLLSALMLASACTKGAPPDGQANVASPDEVASSAPAASATGGLDRRHKGDAAPAAAFRTLDGEPATLAGFTGKPLLVNLWATWCAPCLKEMPTLDRLAASGAVRVLPVSEDLEGAAKVRPFLAHARFTALKPALDPALALSTAFQASLPLSILYDSRGKEVWRYSGGLDWTGATAKALLAEAG